MVYLSLVHGAKGIVWYTWDDGPNMGAKYHPALQATLRELCGEIRALAPLLLGGGQRQFTAAEGKVHGLVCGSPAGRRLLVVNTAAEAVTAAVEVTEAKPGQRFTPGGGGPTVQAQGRSVALALEPLGVHVLSF